MCQYLIFEYNGSDILSLDLKNLYAGEIKPTIELLAYEKGCEISDITMRLGDTGSLE